MRSTITTRVTARVTTGATREAAREALFQIAGEERDSSDSVNRKRQGLLTSPDAVFADPVGYLRRLGLEAELVIEGAGSLAPAA